MAWLDQWIKTTKNGPPIEYPAVPLLEQLAQVHATALAIVSADPTVRRRLAKAESGLTKIEAEVEVGLVELEQLLQLADQLLALVVVGGAHRRRFQA